MVGDADIRVAFEVKEGIEVATLKAVESDDEVEGGTLLMNVPFGRNDKPFCVELTAPEGDVNGTTYKIGLGGSIVNASSGGGMVSFSVGQYPILWLVVDSDVTELVQEKPPLDGEPQVGTQPVEPISDAIKAKRADVVEAASIPGEPLAPITAFSVLGLFDVPNDGYGGVLYLATIVGILIAVLVVARLKKLKKPAQPKQTNLPSQGKNYLLED
jgi:hypothetical protein